MKRLLLISLFLINCKSEATTTVSPDGRRMAIATCDWGGSASCWNQIGEACPKGYIILESGLFTIRAECK